MGMTVQFISNRITTSFNKVLDLSTDDQAKMQYVLEMIIGDLSKVLFMFLLFMIVDKHVLYLYAVTILSILRTYTGGIHFKTYKGCFIFSLVFFITVIILHSKLILETNLSLIVFTLNILIMVFVSPIQSSTRPRYTKQKRIVFKTVGLIFILIHMIGYYNNQNPYFTISIWVITLQCIQLLYARWEMKINEKF